MSKFQKPILSSTRSFKKLSNRYGVLHKFRQLSSHLNSQAVAENTPPNISHIPPNLLNDSSFLNSLHGHVNSWIKAIQAVTKLNRDVASGTASQEINFWLSLERALDNIEAQLRSDEVNMVVSCLRNARRFRATVSFIADTGLKDATDQGTYLASFFSFPY